MVRTLQGKAGPAANNPLTDAEFRDIAANNNLTDFLRKVVAKVRANPCILNRNCDVPAGQVNVGSPYGLGAKAGIPMHLGSGRSVRNASLAGQLSATPVATSFVVIGGVMVTKKVVLLFFLTCQFHLLKLSKMSTQ